MFREFLGGKVISITRQRPYAGFQKVPLTASKNKGIKAKHLGILKLYWTKLEHAMPDKLSRDCFINAFHYIINF